MMARLKAALLRIGACLFARQLRDDQKTDHVSVLDAARNIANEAPIAHQDIADRLGKEGF